MKTRPIFCLFQVLGLLFYGVRPGIAQTRDLPPSAPQDEIWVVQSYRLPTDYRWGLPNISTDPKPGADDVAPVDEIRTDPLPKADAEDAVWIDYLRKSTALIAGQLRGYGLYIPEGSVFLHDRTAGTLAVRIRKAQLESITQFVQSQLQSVPRNLVFALDVVEAEPAVVRQWLTETTGVADHTATWKRAEDLVKKGSAKSVGQMLLQSLSGQRVEGVCGMEELCLTDFALEEGGFVEWMREPHAEGLHLALDPVLGPDDRTIDMSLDLRVPFGPPITRFEYVENAGAAGRVDVPVRDRPQAKLECTLTMRSGANMLIGAWTPRYPDLAGRKAVMQSAFLHAERLLSLPPENKKLARRLTELAERAFPTASPALKKGVDDVSMETRAYRVPPDLLSADQAPAAAVQLMKDQGIPFPAGAKAVFLRDSSKLVVKNTRENLDLVENWIGVHGCGHHVPAVVTFTLELIEGDAASIREMMRLARGEPDHGDILKRIDAAGGKSGIRHVDTLRLSGRSGQAPKIEIGVERAYVESSHFYYPSTPANTVTPSEPAPAAPAPALSTEASPSKPQHPPQIIPSMGTRMVGTLVELQPTLEPDGVTANVSAALEHHFAPPGEPFTNSGSEVKPQQLKVPSLGFHFAKISASMRVLSGTTRLIGVWKPEGAREYDGREVLQAAFLRVDIVNME